MRTGLVNVTVTPGARAPVLSLTLPVMLPVCSDWARADGARAVVVKVSTAAPARAATVIRTRGKKRGFHLIEIASTRVKGPPGKAGSTGFSFAAGGGSRHGDRTHTSMHQGVHHPAGAVVEMALDRPARSIRIAPLDRIDDRVV